MNNHESKDKKRNIIPTSPEKSSQQTPAVHPPLQCDLAPGITLGIRVGPFEPTLSWPSSGTQSYGPIGQQWQRQYNPNLAPHVIPTLSAQVLQGIKYINNQEEIRNKLLKFWGEGH